MIQQMLANTQLQYILDTTVYIRYSYLKKKTGEFPGGPVVKNPSANAGDMGLIPPAGRSHELQGN